MCLAMVLCYTSLLVYGDYIHSEHHLVGDILFFVHRHIRVYHILANVLRKYRRKSTTMSNRFGTVS